ncbi:HAD family hydrolase [Algisphaera agarilytica]|uniref:phosphoglycolate phosphatase n=1 Tax=Algisphaera agarilytica TaxID=1385975 RepID=A0A7X0HBN4_9BACT|nr:HAD family hydrolase [Algisphaera agarilytica]MBB6431454.1 phosphoglycolate phosphatase-like HAD superfamily hydrolase [Algisphaera agarilytica]
MPRTMLLFDIDGTLVDTGGSGLRVLHDTAAELFDGQLSFEGIDTAGRLDPSLFAEAARKSGFDPGPSDHDRLRDAYIEALDRVLASVDTQLRSLPGTLDLMAELAQLVADRNGDAPVLGCLTGNYGGAARVKLRAAGFDPGLFTVSVFGDEAPTRPGLTEIALQRYEAEHCHAPDPARVVVIGDTPHDIDCAHAHGCVALAVATGRFDRQQLTEAGADIVADDLSDASVVLDLIR